MDKICTSLEQSKKLIELEIDVNTADMCYCPMMNIDSGKNEGYLEVPECYSFSEVKDSLVPYLPAWSLTALLKLMPSELITENKFGKYKYEIKIRKYKLTDDVDIYQIGYGNYKWHEDGSCSWKDMINTGEKEELLDAAFEMVCWLKENGNI